MASFPPKFSACTTNLCFAFFGGYCTDTLCLTLTDSLRLYISMQSFISRTSGGVAQLGERLTWQSRGHGFDPTVSTILIQDKRFLLLSLFCSILYPEIPNMLSAVFGCNPFNLCGTYALDFRDSLSPCDAHTSRNYGGRETARVPCRANRSRSSVAPSALRE